MIEFFSGLATYWNVGAAKASFPGGLWFSEAKSRAIYPYAVINRTPTRPSRRSSNINTYRGSFDVAIFYREVDGTDPAGATGVLAGTMRDFFHGAEFALSNNFYLMSLRVGAVQNPDAVKSMQGVWRAVVSFDYLVGK